MRLPRWIQALALLGLAFLVLPLLAMLTRVDWPHLPQDLLSTESLTALRLSLITGACATTVCFVVGFPLALVMSRASERVASILRALVLIPLTLPPMVGGLALLSLLGRSGLIGKSLYLSTGFSLPYSTTGVVLAQTFVALPFLVVSLEGSLRSVGGRYEVIASSLGAGRLTVLRRITLPLVVPGLVAGLVLAFARAMGEFGATALFAGNTPGVTRTMPLAIYTAYNGVGVSQDSALALSLLLLVSASAIVLGLRSWRGTSPRPEREKAVGA